jgi:uncharacterized protein YktB (UPF0637 family)
MEFTGFTKQDFNVFLIDGLEARMEAIKETIQPKLALLGEYFSPMLTSLTGDEMFSHVAKHARRSVNPPNDTWVAFANNPRGYKMLPHFQIGLWNTQLFIWFAVIYEAPQKEVMAERLSKKVAKIYKEIPKDYYWSLDHTKPEAALHGSLKKADLLGYFERLEKVKKAEILCGLVLDKEKVIGLPADDLLNVMTQVFTNVAPLYKIAQKIK